MPASKKIALTKKTPISGTKDQILEVALNLFIAQGYDATPTSQISKEANVSTGTLFYYFPNKNLILEQLYLSIKKELSTYLQQKDDFTLPTKKRLFTCLKGYVEWVNANPKKTVFLDQFYHSANISKTIKQEAYDEFDQMKEIVEAALHEGILKELPLEFHLIMIECIMNGLISLAKSGKTELSNDQLTAAGLDMLLKN
ncbi:MAG TPA: TetR/AcrR family transcriptional regulator [Candidatus Acidoferrales bacterium]|nr:TetR/AcrR family transcriptional regulator [Candidatus Acidoferrales bacterium]